MTNHLEQAKENISKVKPVTAGLDVWVEYATAHALIAIAEGQADRNYWLKIIAEQLEKIGDRVVIQTDGYSMDDIVKIIDAYKENK